MNYMLQRFFDFSSYTFLSISAVTNWETMKGNISFFLALILTFVTLYTRYLEIKDRKRKEKEEENKQNHENEHENE